MSALSATVRVNGPRVPRARHRSGLGAVLTRPRCGLSPNRPHQLEGRRIDPPPSPPIPAATIPDATAAAVPPLEPAGDRSRSHGFRVQPCAAVSVKGQIPNSGIRVLPMITAPASRRRVTTSESARAGVVTDAPPNAVGTPRTSFSSLIAIGTPCSGPAGAPSRSAASSRSASARASSCRTVENALSVGSRRAISAKLCSTSSREVTWPSTTQERWL